MVPEPIELGIDGDRRVHPRVAMSCPCKVYDPRAERYVAGETRDISSHGLLIDIPRLTHLKPGDTLHIGVATKRRQVVLRAAEMVKAIVVRAMATVDDHTAIAVRLEAAHAADHSNSNLMNLAA